MNRIIREAQPSEAVISAGMEPNGGFVIEDGGKIASRPSCPRPWQQPSYESHDGLP